MYEFRVHPELYACPNFDNLIEIVGTGTVFCKQG